MKNLVIYRKKINQWVFVKTSENYSTKRGLYYDDKGGSYKCQFINEHRKYNGKHVYSFYFRGTKDTKRVFYLCLTTLESLKFTLEQRFITNSIKNLIYSILKVSITV